MSKGTTPARMMGWTTARKMNVDKSCIREDPNSDMDSDKRKSMSSVSFENLFNIRPTGVISKKVTGARINVFNALKCMTREARREESRFIKDLIAVSKTYPRANPRYPPTYTILL